MKQPKPYLRCTCGVMRYRAAMGEHCDAEHTSDCALFERPPDEIDGDADADGDES